MMFIVRSLLFSLVRRVIGLPGIALMAALLYFYMKNKF